jgi:hypothetical protein
MPRGFEHGREALIGSMYDAVLDAWLWITVLEGIADPTDSAAALIHGYSVDRKIYTFHELGRIDPDCKRRHELYHVANPWMRASRFTAGYVVCSDELIRWRSSSSRGFCDDVLRPQNIAHGTIVDVISRPEFKVSINVERSEAKGPFSAPDIAVLNSLPPHLRRAGELLQTMSGTRMQHVPYRDSAALLSDLVAGRVTMFFGNIASVLPQVRDGHLRALAVTSFRRSPAKPELSTLDELGFSRLHEEALKAVTAHFPSWADGVRTSHPRLAAHRRPRLSQSPLHEKRRDSQPHYGVLPSGRHGGIDVRAAGGE